MDKLLLLMCNFFSCLAVTAIMFQFMNSRYKKSIKKIYVYGIIEIVIILCAVCITLINISLLNLITWFVVFGISAYFLYYEDIDKPLRRILECEALMFCMVVCESFGVIFLHWILQVVSFENINSTVLRCLEVTFSALMIIFFYYLVISRIMKKSNIPYSKKQYVLYFIILVYSFINMLIIIEIFRQGQVNFLCTINIGCIVLADLYLLYFIKMADEKNYFEHQVKVLEQQANIQYEYYLEQSKKYDKTIQILHDVNKHIKTIGELYTAGQEQTASEYINGIGDLLKPLIPIQYTGNPILNILLTDKEILMKDKGISTEIRIDNVSLDFVDPIDVTTIFGNLLDNAIEAAEKTEGEKYIYIKVGSRYQMIVIKIENSCGIVKWKNNMPISEKGENRGIGLLNVKSSIEKYDGNLKLKQENQKFIAEIFLNS